MSLTKKKEDAFRNACYMSMPFHRIVNTIKDCHRARISSTKKFPIDTLKMYLVIKGSILEHINFTRTLYNNLGARVCPTGAIS